MEILAAGGIVFDARRRLLLVQRRFDPGAGSWSVPGGKCEPGETTEQACVRELAEETGLIVSVLGLAGQVRRAAPPADVFVIDDYVCVVDGGALTAGSDAADAGWFSRAELDGLELVDGLVQALTDWGQLPD